MTREEQNRKLKAFITCLKCEVSGKLCDDNCPTQYEAGNMGEIIENLETIAKALEQEPTTKNDLGVDWESYKDADGNSLDDLILEVLQNNFDCGNTYGYKVADEIIGLLPPVTPQESRWIPTSERLPEKNIEVLITTEWDCITIGEMFSNNDWFIHEGATTTNIDDIKAWMPLPKPYREVEE